LGSVSCGSSVPSQGPAYYRGGDGALLRLAHICPPRNRPCQYPGGDTDLSRALPKYAFFSVVRITIAYFLSLAFALVYGYVAAYSAKAERFMVALLDILQSIPVLSFLPGVMLAMIALFPDRQLGVELGCIILILTARSGI